MKVYNIVTIKNRRVVELNSYPVHESQLDDEVFEIVSNDFLHKINIKVKSIFEKMFFIHKHSLVTDKEILDIDFIDDLFNECALKNKFFENEDVVIEIMASRI